MREQGSEDSIGRCQFAQIGIVFIRAFDGYKVIVFQNEVGLCLIDCRDGSMNMLIFLAEAIKNNFS